MSSKGHAGIKCVLHFVKDVSSFWCPIYCVVLHKLLFKFCM